MDPEEGEIPTEKPQNKCVRTSEKYWVASPAEFFTHNTLMPNGTMSLGAKLNSVMRLSMVITLLLCTYNYKLALIFFILSALINCIFWIMYNDEE